MLSMDNHKCTSVMTLVTCVTLADWLVPGKPSLENQYLVNAMCCGSVCVCAQVLCPERMGRKLEPTERWMNANMDKQMCLWSGRQNEQQL